MPTHGLAVTLPFNALRPTPRGQTLLDVATEMPGAWTSVGGVERGYGHGVKFVPWNTNGVTALKIECTVQEAATALGTVPADLAMEPFRLYDALTCSTMSVDAADLDERLRSRHEVACSAAIANQLVDSTVTNNDGLAQVADVVGAGAALSVQRAFAELEDFYASKAWNARGFFHVAPSVLSLAVAAGSVVSSGGGWVTPTGHVVIPDAGYRTAAKPTGQANPSTSERWIYVSGEIFYAMAEVDVIGAANNETLKMTRNQWERIADTYAVLAFDPEPVGAARVNLAA